MTKAELILAVASEGAMTQNAAKHAVETVLSELVKGIAKDDRTYINGFGIFSKSTRSARTGRNPRTGEPVEIPAKEVVKFKAQFGV